MRVKWGLFKLICVRVVGGLLRVMCVEHGGSVEGERVGHGGLLSVRSIAALCLFRVT